MRNTNFFSCLTNNLKEIEQIFKNYEFNAYDYIHYENIGKIDIKEIKEKYKNLKPETIRTIALYSKNEKIRNILLSKINKKDNDLQDKICELIKPITIELTKNNYIDKTYEENCFINYKIELQKNNKIDKETMDEIFENIELKINLYAVYELEYLFQEILSRIMNKTDNNNIETLLKIKEYAINNMPKITGKITYTPKYKHEKNISWRTNRRRSKRVYIK